MSNWELMLLSLGAVMLIYYIVIWHPDMVNPGVFDRIRPVVLSYLQTMINTAYSGTYLNILLYFQ